MPYSHVKRCPFCNFTTPYIAFEHDAAQISISTSNIFHCSRARLLLQSIMCMAAMFVLCISGMTLLGIFLDLVAMVELHGWPISDWPNWFDSTRGLLFLVSLETAADFGDLTVESSEHWLLIGVPCATFTIGLIAASVVHARVPRSTDVEQRYTVYGTGIGNNLSGSFSEDKLIKFLKELRQRRPRIVNQQTQPATPSSPEPVRPDPSTPRTHFGSGNLDHPETPPPAYSSGIK